MPLEINGIHYKQKPFEGTLVIESPKETHEGTYQCLAKNELGTALSVKSTLKLAGQYICSIHAIEKKSVFIMLKTIVIP